MLEKLPHAVGHALRNIKAGAGKTLYYEEEFSGVPEAIRVSSPAFPAFGRLPARFTADGEKISPPLLWRGVPEQSHSLLLVVQDADSPTPQPLTHALVLDLPPYDGGLDEGELPGAGRKGEFHRMGRNSYLRSQYLPPDPPPGHGEHHYLFQVYALDSVLALKEHPSLAALHEAIRGHVIARGVLVGTYSRA